MQKMSERMVEDMKLAGFAERTLDRHWDLFDLIQPRHGFPLPVVLSREEVRRLLGAVRNDPAKTALTLIYACGLRAWCRLGTKR